VHNRPGIQAGIQGAGDVLGLQRTIGNQAVQRLLSGQLSPRGPASLRAVSPTELQAVASQREGYAAFGALQSSDMQTVTSKSGREMAQGNWVLGFVTRPQNYTVPTYLVQYSRTGPNAWDRWVARLVSLSRADEGVTEGFYVADGMYDTGRETRRMPIRALISDKISNSARAAETEHLMDYWRAFEITLRAAQRVIDYFAIHDVASLQPPEGGAMPLSGVEPELAQQTHIRLAAAFGRLGADSARWGAAYVERYDRTGERDRLRWHTHGDSGLKDANGYYYYEVNKGQSQIDVDNPGSNSSQVVDYQ
jgi:hypothetical protein